MPLPQSPAKAAPPGASPAPLTGGGDEQGAKGDGSCSPGPAQGCCSTRAGPGCREQREQQPKHGWGVGASRASRSAQLVCLVFQGHRGGGKERKESEKKKLTQKPQGIFCLFRILGREKIATVIQSIWDNNSLFTVCMQRRQAGSTAQGRGMRNLPRLRRGPTASA